MKDDAILARMNELVVLFADIPDNVLLRFVNRNSVVCTEFERPAILRALARKSNTGREQLKAFLFKSMPDSLLKAPTWGWGTSLKSRYEKNVTCDGLCTFEPPLPKEKPAHDEDFVKNAKEVFRRDRELLKKIQQSDELLIRRELMDEAEFNTACGDSEAARAEAAFRDGIVRSKLAELERYVKEQIAELRRENRAYLESLRRELLPSRPDQASLPEATTGLPDKTE